MLHSKTRTLIILRLYLSFKRLQNTVKQGYEGFGKQTEEWSRYWCPTCFLEPKPRICRNFERFVFQLLSEKLLKSESAKWGVCGPRKFFWEMYLMRTLSSFFGLSQIFLFAKWQGCELLSLICEREVFSAVVNFAKNAASVCLQCARCVQRFFT